MNFTDTFPGKWSVGWVLMALIAVLVAACSQAHNGQAAARKSNVVTSRNEVLLLAPLEGGIAGWCVAIEVGECKVARAFSGPIVAQVNGNKYPRAHENIVLTTENVAAVSQDGGRPVPTRSEPRLEDNLRVAFIHSGHTDQLENIPGFGMFPARPRVVALDRTGKKLGVISVPQGSLVFAVQRRSWVNGQPQRGICSIYATRFDGLKAQSGIVVVNIARRHAMLPGRPFLVCASTIYALEGDSLLGSVLVDLTDPGTMPGPLPGMSPLAGHPDIFQGLGGGVLGRKGSSENLLARRIAGAWLVVSGGRGIWQRLDVLEHLHATMHPW